MAIESIPPISPVAAVTPMQTVSRAPETTPDAREAVEQENDARRNAEAVSGASPAYLAGPGNSAAPGSVGSRLSVTPAPSDTEGALQSASAQISQVYSGSSPSPADMRAASDAYRREAAAEDQLARQAQGNGARSLDITV